MLSVIVMQPRAIGHTHEALVCARPHAQNVVALALHLEVAPEIQTAGYDLSARQSERVNIETNAAIGS